MTTYKIFYEDTMTSYYLENTFDTWESADDWIKNNIGNTSCHKIEEEVWLDLY